MSIKEMITDIQQEALEEIGAAKNRAKAETTKALVAKADQFETYYESQKTKLQTQLERKEASLKAEKDFAYRNLALISEDKFAQSLVPFIKQTLENFPTQHSPQYQNIFVSWLNQAASVLGGKELTLRVHPRDKNLPPSDKLYRIIEDPSVIAGFIASAEGGVSVDLSFPSLFQERQNSLQSLVMTLLRAEVAAKADSPGANSSGSKENS